MTEAAGLLTRSGDPFATGASVYFDLHPEIRDPLPRIYVEVQPEGTDRSFLALVDTGGHYCILHPAVAREIRLGERLTETRLQTARGLLTGELYSHRITLLARHGESLDVSATLFLSPDWRGPNLLGYVGVLDRLRFAIDPGENRFFFGPLT